MPGFLILLKLRMKGARISLLGWILSRAYPAVCGGRVSPGVKPGQLLECKGVDDTPKAPANSTNPGPKPSPRLGPSVIRLVLPQLAIRPITQLGPKFETP